MRIGFIGAGKVATAFGHYLHDHGVAISGYYDRHDEKVARASHATQSQPYPNAASVAAGSDILLITTRDDQIAGVCEDLCRQKSVHGHHLIGHMSGAHSSRILAEAGRLGAAVFSLHPLQAFADEDKALAELPNTYFSLEGESERLQPIKQMLALIGNRYFSISPEHKNLYHLSACILSNYLVTLMDSGLAALGKSGIDPREGFQAMRPLIEGTLSNIARMGPAKALTGPIARGDAGTVEQHLKALKNSGLIDIESLYRQLGLQTLKLARQSALSSSEKATAVRQLLESN
jgi:predicted short-subunit dehydrogenase-like oxidoreductase (DUF2520 family)